MKLLNTLINNKGTVSSALSKILAKEALKGQTQILLEAIELVKYQTKNVRSGAAKIIEKVAEENPTLVAPYLVELLPAFEYTEPQTRWMLIHTFGICARLNPDVAIQMFTRAEEYLAPVNGTCLRESTVKYFGYIGALSPAQAKRSFEVIMRFTESYPGRAIRALKSFQQFVHHLEKNQKYILLEYAENLLKCNKPSLVKEARKLLNLIDL